MDLDIRVIRPKEFIKITPNGEIDLAQSERLLLTLARSISRRVTVMSC